MSSLDPPVEFGIHPAFDGHGGIDLRVQCICFQAAVGKINP